MARHVTVNAKLRRPEICGAAESLLIDNTLVERLLPLLTDDLVKGGCTLRGDQACQKIDPRIGAASKEDWSTEYLDKIISVKVVNGVDEAISHINQFGSNHTEAVLTKNEDVATAFLMVLIVGLFYIMHPRNLQMAVSLEWGQRSEYPQESFMLGDLWVQSN